MNFQTEAPGVLTRDAPGVPPVSRARRLYALVLVTVVLLAVSTRLPMIHATDLWLDEACTVIDSQEALAGIKSLLPDSSHGGLRFAAGHPPGYYILTGSLFKVFGANGVVARSISLFFSCACVVVVLASFRSGGSGLERVLASGWIAIHPLSIYYGVEAKQYALLWFEGSLLILILRRDGSLGRVLAAFLVQLAALYTHNFGALFAPLFLVAAMFSRQPSPLIAALSFAVLLWLPWITVVLPDQLEVHAGATNFKAELLAGMGPMDRLAASAGAMFGAPPFPQYLRTLAWVEAAPIRALAWCAFPLGCWGAVSLWRQGERRFLALLLVSILSTWILLWGVDQHLPLFLPGRYETSALPAMAWLVGAGCVVTTPWARAVVPVLVVGSFLGVAATSQAFIGGPESHRYRAVLGAVGDAGGGAEDIVAVGFVWAPLHVAMADSVGAETKIPVFPAAVELSAGEPNRVPLSPGGVEAEAAALAMQKRKRSFVVAERRDQVWLAVLLQAYRAQECAVRPVTSVGSIAIDEVECPTTSG
jgi:4-amino-4-deoxy-L-arabinose transferase-like glycosyltransferase